MQRCAQLRERVSGKLRLGCSPDRAAGRLRFEGGEKPGQECVISGESIYTWIYALPEGEPTRLGVTVTSASVDTDTNLTVTFDGRVCLRVSGRGAPWTTHDVWWLGAAVPVAPVL